MNSTEKLNSLKEFATTELNNILTFWVNNAIDNVNGGIVGRIDSANVVDNTASKGLILNARVLWTFSVAYQTLKKPELLEVANRAYNYIQTYFLDKANGGYFWKLKNNGEPEDTKKQIYAQAFVMYGFSEYYTITKNEEVLVAAKNIFELIEKHSLDKAKNGYFEAFSHDWSEIGDLRLSVLDMNEKKTMNTHLHVLEAYAALYKVWKNPVLKDRILNLLDVFSEIILNKADNHYNLFFDENWACKSDIISFGHDIEGSWLLHEAAEIAGDEKYIAKFKKIAVEMAEGVIPAINQHGGLEHDRHRGKDGDGELEWWAQAESVVGFLNAFQISNNEMFIDKAVLIKDFISKNFIDRTNGEWFYRIDKNLVPFSHYDKVGFWKCPYHNGRMCLELIHRIN